MLRVYRRITGLMVFAWILGACATAYFHWRAFDRGQQDSKQLDEQIAFVESDRLLARIEHFGKLARVLASSAQFANPQDFRLDGVRLRTVVRAVASRIAFYDGISSWLPAEFGPSSPVAGMPRLPSAWQLARGLPLRAPSGALLARSRRLLAEQTIAEDPEILHIAELDSVGRVVFLVPYASQVRLGVFNVSRILLPRGVDLRSAVANILPHEALVPGRDGRVVSFMAPIPRSSGTDYLLVTVQREIKSEVVSHGDYGLFDSSNRLVMYSGDETHVLHDRNLARNPGMSLPVPYGEYTLVSFDSHPPDRHLLLTSLAAVTVVQLLTLAMFDFLIYKLLLWIARLQWGSDHAQEHVQRRVQDLAHDFQNRILTLRTLMGNVTGKLDLDQLQRLSGTISDFSAYTDYLSGKLVSDAFAPPEPSRATTESQPRAGTYLRGILETVTQQQAAAFGHDIPIVFGPEFSGREPFVKIGRAELTRIMSNLLWNSIEACVLAGTHDISVSVALHGRYVDVRVVDNGSGIAPEDHRRIFDSGFTTKGEGRGQGLAGCAQMAAEFEGTLELVESFPGQGSTLRLRLMTCPTPSWFVNEVTLTDSSVLVVVDDEGDVFDYWSKTIAARLEGIRLSPDRRPRLISISGPAEFRKKGSALKEGTLFLVDYKFKDEETTGVDLIEEFGLERKAILVTHHFEQRDVMDAVARLDIRLLPKTYMLNAKFPLDIGGDK